MTKKEMEKKVLALEEKMKLLEKNTESILKYVKDTHAVVTSDISWINGRAVKKSDFHGGLE